MGRVGKKAEGREREENIREGKDERGGEKTRKEVGRERKTDKE